MKELLETIPDTLALIIPFLVVYIAETKAKLPFMRSLKLARFSLSGRLKYRMASVSRLVCSVVTRVCRRKKTMCVTVSIVLLTMWALHFVEPYELLMHAGCSSSLITCVTWQIILRNFLYCISIIQCHSLDNLVCYYVTPFCSAVCWYSADIPFPASTDGIATNRWIS